MKESVTLGQGDGVPEKPAALSAQRLRDHRLELNNNCAERSIKLFVIKQEFLFANAPTEEKGSVVIFSLI